MRVEHVVCLDCAREWVTEMDARTLAGAEPTTESGPESHRVENHRVRRKVLAT